MQTHNPFKEHNTVEPPNTGHVGTRSFVLYREVSFIRRLKCTGVIGIGTSRFVLNREVFFIRSVLYQRFHCILKFYYSYVYVCTTLILLPFLYSSEYKLVQACKKTKLYGLAVQTIAKQLHTNSHKYE